MRYLKKRWAISLILALASLSASGDDAHPRVALTDFAYADQPAGLDRDAANLTAAVQALLSGRGDIAWVDRQEIGRAFEEISFGLSGISAEASAVRVGNLVRADMLVRGTLLPLSDHKAALNLSVIDSRRAGLLAMQGMLLELDSQGRLVAGGDEIARIGRVVSAVVAAAAARLEGIAEKTVMAPLFFRNTGPHSRLDFVEERLFGMLREKAETTGSVHPLQFPGRTEAEGEAELVLMGLTEEDSEAWRKVADVYIWGEFAELPTGEKEVAFEDVPFRIEVTLWNGHDERASIKKEGIVRNLNQTMEAICAEVVERSRRAARAEAPATGERFAVASALRERAEGIQRKISRAGVAERRRLYGYQLKLLETACFFHPLDQALRAERLARAWAPYNPLEPLATLGGQWRRIEQYFAHLERFPLDPDLQPDYELREQVVTVLYEAAQALNRRDRHNLSGVRAHEQKKEMARLMIREIHAVNAVSQARDDERAEAMNERFFEWIYQGRGPGAFSPFWRNAEILHLFTEELWEYFRPTYLELRKQGVEDSAFQRFVGNLLSVYHPFGLTHQAIAMLEEGYTGEEASGASAAESSAGGTRSRSNQGKETTRPPWEAMELASDTAEGFSLSSQVTLSASEVLVWPKVFYTGRDFRPQRGAVHRWHFLKWHEGVLWMSESANRALPSEDGWRNEAGFGYFWAYDPVSGRMRNLTRDLPPHVTFNDIVFDRDDLWLSVAKEGVWRWDSVENEVTRMGVSDGMISHDVRAGASWNGSLFFAGRSSGKAMLSRYSVEDDKWFAVEQDAAAADDVVVDQLARFEDWLLLAGRELELYNARTREWRKLSLNWKPVNPGTMGAGPRSASKFSAAVGKDGFWIARGGSLFLIDPRQSWERGNRRPAASHKLPGTAAGLAVQDGVLWVGIERDQVFRVSARGTRSISFLAVHGFDVAKEEWVARVPIDDVRIDHITASANNVWVAGSRIWEIDTERLRGRGSEGKDDDFWRSRLFGEGNPLHAAVWKGDAAGLQSALGEGADPDIRCERGRTPLLRAVLRGDVEMVDALLKSGADPDLAAKDGMFPLLTATDAGDARLVSILLGAGADASNQGPSPRYKFEGLRHYSQGRDPFVGASDPPAPPANVRAEVLSSTAVRLTWEPGSGNESRFVLYRPYMSPVNLDGASRAYVDTPPESVRQAGEIQYILRAVNGANPGHSMDSEPREASAVLVTASLPRPENDPPDAYLPAEEQPAQWVSFMDPREPILLRRSALMGAAASGRKAILDLLIDAGADVDGEDVFGDTALLHAVRESQHESALLLLDRGADINTRNHNGTTALGIEYGRRDNLSRFMDLLERGADPNLGGRYILLMSAALAGRINDVELLLEYGADIHAATVSGETALGLAAGRGFHELVELFFDRGFDPTLPYWRFLDIGQIGDQAMIMAIDEGLDDLLEGLLEAGIDPNVERFEGPPLHRASRLNNAGAVRILIRHGADPNYKDRNGLMAFDLAKDDEVRRLLEPAEPRGVPLPSSRTVLDVGPPVDDPRSERTDAERVLDQRLLAAAEEADRAVAEGLLLEGAWIDTRDETGQTPLIRALRNGDNPFVRWLLDQGPTLNVVTGRGYSPLAFAVQLGDEGLVRELLERGASPDLRRASADTPLQVAVQQHGYPLARLLLDYGACSRQMGFSRNGYRANPLMLAAGRGQKETVQLLLDRGARPDAYDLSFVRIGGSGQEVERRQGPNVLFWAASSDDPEMIDYLVERGADLRHESDGGHNPLCWAAETGAAATTAHLLSLGLTYPHSLDPPSRNLSEEILEILQAGGAN